MGDPEANKCQPTAMAMRVLRKEFAELKEGKLEGFHVKLVDEGDLFDWEVGVFGPPNTVYQGAYLKASMRFPDTYPMQPPDFFFLTKMFHPNVHVSGMMCMSLLYDGCWNTTMSARTVLLSVVSLLTGPDTDWPCDMEAALLYNRWRDSNGEDKEYEERVALQKNNWKEMARLDGVTVPETVEEYCRTGRTQNLPEKDGFSLNDLSSDSDGDSTASSSDSEGEEDEHVDIFDPNSPIVLDGVD